MKPTKEHEKTAGYILNCPSQVMPGTVSVTRKERLAQALADAEERGIRRAADVCKHRCAFQTEKIILALIGEDDVDYSNYEPGSSGSSSKKGGIP